MSLAPNPAAAIFDDRLRAALRESVHAKRPSLRVREAVLRIVTDMLYPPAISSDKRAPDAPRANPHVLIFEAQHRSLMKGI